MKSGGPPEDAVAQFEAALEALPPDAEPARRARFHANLAEAYRLRGGTETVPDIEHAVEHARTAAALFRPDADVRGEALALLTLAAALAHRVPGYRERNRDDAREALHRVLSLVTPEDEPDVWGRAHLDLGVLFATDFDPGRFRETRAQAADHLRTAIDFLREDRWPREWALAQYNLGVVLEETGDRDAARTQFRRALDVFTPGLWPADCARTLRALGDLDRDVQAYRQALLLYGTRSHPRERRDTLQRLGDLHAERGEWRAADRCYAKAIELDERIWQAQRTPAGRTAELAATNRLHAGAAFSALRLGERDVALERLERGRARSSAGASEALGVRDIAALAPAEGALVHLLVTRAGSAAFVVRHGVDHVAEGDVVDLPAFAHADVESLLAGEAGAAGWTQGYFAWQNGGATDAWQRTIEAVCARLWSSLMGVVHERLQGLEMKAQSHVVILPHGALALVPLHAAWREEPGGRRSFVDDWTVSYAPGARLLREALAVQPAHAAQARLLAVADPIGDLPFARAECRAVRRVFAADRADVVEGAEATAPAVLERAAAGATHLHFACHGLYHWSNVERSGLELADGDLTLERIASAELDLRATRLVTLSACDTGIAQIFRRVQGNVFTWSADEFEGLPRAFIEAGAGAVLSSLWPVDDCSTALLMERFYAHHVGEGMGVAEALRSAQRWVRQLTRDEVLERIAVLPPEDVVDLHAEVGALERDALPFGHPYYWAAFVATGAA